ncbi:MAG: tetratricopeptide repeat protein, partial [Geopsychrobacter sp.]|nr:tetratricopeptide repeat protein [Geopsychrobacter sp.]
KLEQALVMAKLALAQKKSSYIYDTLGWIYYRLHGYVDALDYLKKAVSLAPDDPLILEHLGDIYAAQQRWRDAEKSYRKSLKFDKTAVEVTLKLQKLLKDHSAR